MWTVSWFRELISSSGCGMTEEELNVGAAQVPVGAGGIVAALDWLAPPDEPWRRGALVGFDGTQGRFHIYRAILEALAIETAASDDRARRSSREEAEKSGGHGRREQLTADAADPRRRVSRAVRTPLVRDAAGMGAAICAAVGVGMHRSWEGAVDAMVREGERVDVDLEMARGYEEVARTYATVIPRIRRLFSETD